MNKQVAGVVVLYHPDISSVIDNIASYLGDLDRLYVVDNSEQKLSAAFHTFVKQANKITYIALGENMGIAYALNTGAQKAIEQGYEWLLTMDQDSKASPGMVNTLVQFALSNKVSKPGIIAARSDTPVRGEVSEGEFSIMETVITSGNLVNLETYQKVGGFENKLFIDYVDHLFSLDIRNAGYQVVQLNHVVFKHHLGNAGVRHFMGVKLIPTHHNPIRKYYIARNRRYVQEKYKSIFPAFVRADQKNRLKELIKLFLYEDQKWVKIKMATRGRKDAKRNKFGKFEQ